MGSIDEIARDLADAFASSPDAVSVDVLTLAQELGAQGLLAGVDHDPETPESSDSP